MRIAAAATAKGRRRKPRLPARDSTAWRQTPPVTGLVERRRGDRAGCVRTTCETTLHCSTRHLSVKGHAFPQTSPCTTVLIVAHFLRPLLGQGMCIGTPRMGIQDGCSARSTGYVRRPVDQAVIDAAVVSTLRTLAADGWLPHGPMDAHSLVATGAVEITRRGLRNYVTSVRIQIKRRTTR
jgi:hypothetical protein